MNYNERDSYICQDYNDGKDIPEIARTYGLTERRISQIFAVCSVVIRPKTKGSMKSLSREHYRIGLHLANYRYSKGLAPATSAEDIGWSTTKFRKVERGTTNLELLDLLDIASYTKTPISELLEVKNIRDNLDS